MPKTKPIRSNKTKPHSARTTSSASPKHQGPGWSPAADFRYISLQPFRGWPNFELNGVSLAHPPLLQPAPAKGGLPLLSPAPCSAAGGCSQVLNKQNLCTQGELLLAGKSTPNQPFSLFLLYTELSQNVKRELGLFVVRGGCVCEGQSDFSGPGLTQQRCTEAKILAKGAPGSAVCDKMKGSSGSISHCWGSRYDLSLCQPG